MIDTPQIDFTKVGVIGWPISHSRSPMIHNYWISKHDLRGTYTRLPIDPANDFKTEIAKLIEQNYQGANVTIPHKEAAFAVADELDAMAAKLGAVNLLTFSAGTIHGRNTDGYGFMAHLKTVADPIYFNIALKQKPVCVLGAGGATRAILAALAEHGVGEIHLCNRTRERAEEIAHLGVPSNVTVFNWDYRDQAVEGCVLLVNTTSLGMADGLALDIGLAGLADEAIVYDIIYTPLETELLKQAKSRGLKAVGGLGMLLHQAVPAFEAWFGVRPEVTDALYELVLADLEIPK